MKTIKDILPDRFKYTLSPAEGKLIDAVRLGNTAVCRSGDEDADKPENADSWGPERTIRGTLIHWLCTDEDAVKFVDDMGVWIDGAKIVGDLSLGSSILPKPLRLYYCDLGHVYLFDTRADTLDFHFSRTRHIFAIGLKTRRDFTLNGVKVDGEVSLRDAKIGGSLLCIGARFIHKRGYSFHAPGLRVRNDMLLSDAKANNEINLEGAHIGGNLNCHGLRVEPEGWEGLSAEDVKKLEAFNADGLKTGGDLVLKRARFKNEVRLLGAEIGGSLDCECARFENEGVSAFTADRLVTKGSVFLRGIKAKGEIRLLNANIGGDLDCIGAELENEGNMALNANKITTKGSTFLSDGFTAKGEVNFVSANIWSVFSCNGAKFENEDGIALICQAARIKGGLILRSMKKFKGELDITHTKAGAFLDDGSGWPEKGNLYLDCLEYGGLTGTGTIKDAKRRIDWLHLQPTEIDGKKVFLPQPYEQLAKVLRQMGHEADAKEILIAKQEDMRKHGNLKWYSLLWNWFLGTTVRHGYSPWRVIGFMAFMLIAGFIVFNKAYDVEVMQPSKERVYMAETYKGRDSLIKEHKEYPKFSCIVYSVDTFIPVVNLHQEDFWLPSAEMPNGRYFRYYLWFHILMGWASTTLVVVYMTGLIRKD